MFTRYSGVAYVPAPLFVAVLSFAGFPTRMMRVVECGRTYPCHGVSCRVWSDVPLPRKQCNVMPEESNP